jgi:membrane-associated protease RseP (regulator of RpoE activity)
MKTIIADRRKITAAILMASFVVLPWSGRAELISAPAAEIVISNRVVTSEISEGDDSPNGAAGNMKQRRIIRIESSQPSQGKASPRQVTWLGISTEDVTEALTAQLGLKSGQGLVVIFVAPDSPAAKAGIQKYDVVEKLDEQLLVDPEQLRKLVQMQKEGDTVKLTLHRGGKKQTVAVELGKRTESLSWSAQAGGAEGFSALTLPGGGSGSWAFANPKGSTAFVTMDKKMINAEVQRNIEEARKEIEEAMRQSARATHMAHQIAPVAPAPPALPSMMQVGNNTTVTVTKDGAAIKTVVKSDETGTLVIVADPKKHLTAHDTNGKLLFDGEIETPEQQQKVPPAVWEKVKPLLPQIKPSADGEPEPHAQIEEEKNSEINLNLPA